MSVSFFLPYLIRNFDLNRIKFQQQQNIKIMKIIISSSLLLASLLVVSCGENKEKANSSAADTTQIATTDTATEKTFAISLVNNKKDPTCGMPVTAGISDTAHYENLVLGFCSTECKNEFLKNPKASLAAAEITKPTN